ncbi:MAG TPA: TolC family protein [Bacteroidia bacterium]|jgi:cobalt-zinc-cadmium efflux system outer membrane protein|nr:TolC family protein [Bacteroidia bacterium]
MRKTGFLLLVLNSLFGFSQVFKQTTPYAPTAPQQSPIVPKDSIRTVTDTIAITLADAEAIFVKNNYAILAAKYNVDAAYALVRQARLFNNPNVYFEPSVYNKQYINPDGSTGKFFPLATGTAGDATSTGDFILNLSWTVSLAQKRIKTANVAKLSADVAKYRFDDLMRSLLFSLRTDFIDLYFGLKSLKLFDEEIITVKNIVAGFEIQYQKGNASLRDITRVRALLLSLQSDRLDLYTALQQNSAKEFTILLNNPKNVYYKPVLNEVEFDSKYNFSSLALTDLIDQALLNRPDLKADLTQLAASDANVKLQKAIGVPDLTLQPGTTRNSNYIQNDPVLGFGLPLPIANRNQGNIQSAKLALASDQEQVKLDYVIVQNDVFATYQKILELQKLNGTFSADFSADFRTLLQEAEKNFNKKNLSLLEFVDMFESYKASMSQYNSIKSQRYSAFEELNFNVGKDVFKK